MIHGLSNSESTVKVQEGQPEPSIESGSKVSAGDPPVPLTTPSRISSSSEWDSAAKAAAPSSSSQPAASSAGMPENQKFECLPSGLMLGKCWIERPIGQGGMGAVYFAHHMALDMPVAIKVLMPHSGKDKAEQANRFIREARLASRIHHPNVVQVLDVGTDEATGINYIVEEYVGGGSVRDLMKKGKLEESQALGIVIDMASALVAASELNIVHRDIKPENILLTERGIAKLADLGIAKECNGQENGLTISHVMMGTPFYISPEQARNTKWVDARADIYSLGATLYHMLCGQPPYLGETAFEVLSNLIAEPVPDPLLKRPDLAPAVAALVMRMMAKDPANRPATAALLLEELTAVRQTVARKASSPITVAASPAAGSRKPLLIAASVILVGAAIALGMLINGPSRNPPTSITPPSPVATPAIPPTPLVNPPTPATPVIPVKEKPPVAEKAIPLQVPDGCQVMAGTVAEPYTNSGWAKAVIHARTKIELVYIPAGEFMMGSSADEENRGDNETQHKVKLTKGFYMGKTEVTQEQWQAIMENNPSMITGASLPVECVNWDECQSFCQKTGLRLPMDAEWEYACRAGTVGVRAGDLDQMGWYRKNSDDRSHAVASKDPNAWGLYDMYGNVWEWCQDWHANYPVTPVTDPTGPAMGTERVIRGGGWDIGADFCRSANRLKYPPTVRSNVTGFRVVLPIPRHP